ncbi:MAG: hypothetical protein LBQ03_01180 [Puniceicoccales bacterium]|jgi:hypothetical protein|nr:hypothetical protein [Puniceicoccales bacterium]
MIRKLTNIEKKLLLAMPVTEHRYKKIIEDSIDKFVVEGMEDGNMGSLAFNPAGNDYNHEDFMDIQNEDKNKSVKVCFDNRTFWKIISEIETNDSDGVPVSIALYVDNFDDIYELDIWKVNFDRVYDLSACFNNYVQGTTSGHEGFFREEKIKNGKKYLYVCYDGGGDKTTCGRILPIHESDTKMKPNKINLGEIDPITRQGCGPADPSKTFKI